jgi:DNA polymerase-3 subunit alpha
MGLRLLPPSINESNALFTVSGNDLRYGLVAVKNIGRGFIYEVMAEREENGVFTSFEEFCQRMYGGDLNRRALDSLIKCGCFDGLGANRRQLMMICQMVIDSVAEHRRRNVEGQIDLFGMSAGSCEASFGGIELPDLAEYSKSDLTRMEREVTGLYLSGHPMDEYRSIVKRFDAVGIGEILVDFAREDGNRVFKDDQKIVVAGVIETVKTKPTRNSSLMAYLTLDDGTGNIELLAFQRVIDESGVYMQTESPVLAYGRLSERDEKDPQIVLDMLRPISDATNPGLKDSNAASVQGKTLYVKLCGEDGPEYERLKLVLMMFPGRERMVIHFEDTKKSVGAKCIIHDAFVQELREMLGEKNVVIK